MPPRPALSTPLRAWKCPSCRFFTTAQSRSAVGPEHPNYISFPEPPQQTYTPRRWVKGILPVPRDVFAGSHGKDQSSDDSLVESTKDAQERKTAPAGSRQAWRLRMAEQRKQNLREGVRELKIRQQTTLRRVSERSARKQEEHARLVAMPEREDERLTRPSTNLDLDALYHGPVPDPSRDARLGAKRARQAAHVAAREADRLDSLHTLYTHAREFIVTPAQLDTALEEAFGTNDNPVTFDVDGGDRTDRANSMWSYGNPMSVQTMLNRAKGESRSEKAVEAGSRTLTLNKERVRRIAEALTGGKMDAENREEKMDSYEINGGY